MHIRKSAWVRDIDTCMCGHWGEGVYMAECKGESFHRKKASLKASVCPRPTRLPPPSRQNYWKLLLCKVVPSSSAASATPPLLSLRSQQSQLGQGSLSSTTVINLGLNWALQPPSPRPGAAVKGSDGWWGGGWRMPLQGVLPPSSF